ncbi:Scr1 family TA system antitoxin-like transcriptional regulator [Streptomyces sp. NBC_01506]|uniref:Scr1 family TA system antitoxin-like transcriptional regulator n=1 Tax=Streptomyces sp. NBC_01506 TaxID=2903887 RepID=UPI00386AE2C8
MAVRLHGLMKDAGLSGHELAVRCGWHKAKSSRIARGVTPPSDTDIRAWCSACGAEEQTADLIAASRNAESMYVEWKQIRAAMSEQLEHLLGVMTRPNVSVGIIPATADRTVWPLEAFYAFDDSQVAVETRLAGRPVQHPRQ